MKKAGYFLLIIMAPFFADVNAQTLKPYILGATSNGTIEEVKSNLKVSLEKEGINILGEYQPANDETRWVIVFSSDDLSQAVNKIKGQTGFALALRIGLTKEGEQILISYTNPAYWGTAYFRDDYPAVEQHYTALTGKLDKAMRASGQYNGKDFGSEDGIEVDDLIKYRYMMGMPRFDDPVELGQFSSFGEAIDKIESNLKKGVENVSLVYSIEIPGEDLKLYGFALAGEDGESEFLPKIDISEPKHTAFLPYEMLVMGGQVILLHGRYRIALSFPDLKMGTFTKIMSTPGNIRDMLELVSE
jgi:uncharacterized protein (DUF302 family)